MALDVTQARNLLVDARHKLDEVAKQIVDDYKSRDIVTAKRREGETASARALGESDARDKIMGEFHDGVRYEFDRVQAALDQWEITEPCPLDKDESFMPALRRLLDEIAKFRGE